VASLGDLEIAVQELPEGGEVVRVSGELDLATVSDFEQTLSQRDASARIVLDLTECTFLDSSAVRAIVRAATRSEAAGGALAVVAPETGIRKALEIARVDSLLPIHSALEEGL
jgi:stage II sporulation protein AA (anti-sigma F factor antagonist)